ncbi:transketolase [Symbiobacterium terraclitae]|uniref:Transketolase n=1 Tax=Symbiobacterium terraclitae TaxID=557451 RepID=A0ABS4JT53_9FIRM|nr:transketolase [Symbiobacterium terraclitae]MBP2018697.1 transketolase [Symbiobacterium terraclitae]
MATPRPDVLLLKDAARRIRCHVIRTALQAGGGHLGGSLSAAEILSVLYFHKLRIRPEEPDWPERDRFILSKGHAAMALYAALAERGFFPVGELATFGVLGSRLQAHPDMSRTPGVDMSTGSLGQGLSAGAGMALAARIGRKDYQTYVLLGDGEIQEGQVWEAALLAGELRLANLTAILDFNRFSQTRATAAVHPPERLALRWEGFGWAVREVDGHDVAALAGALDAPADGRPLLVVAHTIKGRGVSFMEGRPEWHSHPLTSEQAARALAELGVAP